jgi:hypothetical protein
VNEEGDDDEFNNDEDDDVFEEVEVMVWSRVGKIHRRGASIGGDLTLFCLFCFVSLRVGEGDDDEFSSDGDDDVFEEAEVMVWSRVARDLQEL